MARIVKHITNDNELVVDGNVDSATATWLNQNYTAGNEIKRIPTNTSGSLGEQKDDSQQVIFTDFISTQLINSWNYDVLEYSYDELFDSLRYMLNVFHSVSEFQIPPHTLTNFIKELSVKYIKDNKYHNFHHGCDVMHTTFRLIIVSKLQTVFSNLELFSMLIAALSHDVGHPGVNNAFLVKTRSDLAMFHNDKSPLENMHCSLLYQLLKKTDLNIFVNLTESQWRESRKIILFMILGTDMAQHFEQVSKTQVKSFNFLKILILLLE